MFESRREEQIIKENKRRGRTQAEAEQRAESPAYYADTFFVSAADRWLHIETELFPILNDSEHILVLVDEGHRSQSSQLHANLVRALPNCARIAFTGTPILDGDRKRTSEIFGDFIDPYPIQQPEADGATVPILDAPWRQSGVMSLPNALFFQQSICPDRILSG